MTTITTTLKKRRMTQMSQKRQTIPDPLKTNLGRPPREWNDTSCINHTDFLDLNTPKTYTLFTILIL